MQEEWGRRLRRLGTGVTTSGAGLPSPGEDEELSRSPTKGDRDPDRPLNPLRIYRVIAPENARQLMEEKENGAYTVFQHLNKMRSRKGRLAAPGTTSTQTLLTVTSLPPHPSGLKPLPMRSAPPP